MKMFYLVQEPKFIFPIEMAVRLLFRSKMHKIKGMLYEQY